MATSKSSVRASRAQNASKNQAQVKRSSEDSTSNEPETVLVPVLSSPYRKAPAVDPNLRDGTVRKEEISVCGYQLPPILHGIQPGLGFQGEPKDYSVSVIWMSRRQIEAMMGSVVQQYPELAQMLGIMKAFMLHLDTVRDEAQFGISASLGSIKAAMPDSAAARNLDGVVKMLGRWDDENRLFLH